MQYSGFRINLFLDPSLRLKRLRFAFLLILTASFAASASQPQQSVNDEAKKLIKQAAKLVRKGEMSRAESALRRAVEIDPARSDSRVELAYILTKRRQLLEAYELSLAVAKAEPT